MVIWDLEAQPLTRDRPGLFRALSGMASRILSTVAADGSRIHDSKDDMATMMNGINGHTELVAPSEPLSLFHNDRTYLLTGGLSTLGLDMATWLYSVRKYSPVRSNADIIPSRRMGHVMSC